MTSHTYSALWNAPLAKGKIDAVVKLPGSKSLTNRELVLSALASEPTTLVEPLISRDSELMMAALESLGASFERSPEHIRVTPINKGQTTDADVAIDCGLAGTVMRFVPPLAGLRAGTVVFDGDVGARRRPMSTTIISLRELGVQVEQSTEDAGRLPFSVAGSGSIRGGQLSIDASESSQFVSGLLLAAARFEEGLTLTHAGEHLPSMPHIEMTLDCLQKRGVKASALGEATWRVEPGPIAGGEVVIEPDLSNAGPFLAAAMVAGGSITIPHWPSITTQVGNEFIWILTEMGASVSLDERGLTLTSDGSIKGIDIDLSIGGELAPVIAVLAALADSPSRISGIAHLRGHETDRLAALTAEINRAGGHCRETEDGLEIVPTTLHGCQWQSYDDHRMATAGAIVGLRVPGIEVENIATTAKTMPNFTDLWLQMLGESA
jgi:3-phosphoshikimate 1-carboxyvinyltransferase